MKYTHLDGVYSPDHKWLEKPKTFKDEYSWLQAMAFGAILTTIAFYLLTK